jgi:hypothetical protein
MSKKLSANVIVGFVSKLYYVFHRLSPVLKQSTPLLLIDIPMINYGIIG